MQLYARNMMTVTAASAVLAVGVVTMTPASSEFAAPRILAADVALVVLVCNAAGVCESYPPPPVEQLVAAAPAYAVTQAAILGADVFEVVGAAAAYGASVATAVVLDVAAEVANSDVFTASVAEIANVPSVVKAKPRSTDESAG